MEAAVTMDDKDWRALKSSLAVQADVLGRISDSQPDEEGLDAESFAPGGLRPDIAAKQHSGSSHPSNETGLLEMATESGVGQTSNEAVLVFLIVYFLLRAIL
jgi:hypothetical protein